VHAAFSRGAAVRVDVHDAGGRQLDGRRVGDVEAAAFGHAGGRGVVTGTHDGLRGDVHAPHAQLGPRHADGVGAQPAAEVEDLAVRAADLAGQLGQTPALVDGQAERAGLLEQRVRGEQARRQLPGEAPRGMGPVTQPAQRLDGGRLVRLAALAQRHHRTQRVAGQFHGQQLLRGRRAEKLQLVERQRHRGQSVMRAEVLQDDGTRRSGRGKGLAFRAAENRLGYR